VGRKRGPFSKGRDKYFVAIERRTTKSKHICFTVDETASRRLTFTSPLPVASKIRKTLLKRHIDRCCIYSRILVEYLPRTSAIREELRKENATEHNRWSIIDRQMQLKLSYRVREVTRSHDSLSVHVEIIDKSLECRPNNV
jgi:predicted transcriptional regulator